MASYRWDERTGRYHDVTTGRFVAESTVRDLVDQIADMASDRMAALSQSLLDGTLSLADWQTQMMTEIKFAHLGAGVLASGGFEQMSPARYGYLGRTIRDEYAALRDFAQQIQSGQQTLDGRLVARARQYGQAARPTFENVRARDDRNRGMTEERNVLHPAHHCGQCRALSGMGWVPIGTLPAIGSRECLASDRCTIERRVGSTEDVAA